MHFTDSSAFLGVPSSLNVSEGSEAIFSCRISNGSHNHLLWLVNNEVYVSKANRNRSISVETQNNRFSTFTITAHPWNDNVEIQCIFQSLFSSNTSCSNETVTCSEKALLRIQGVFNKCILITVLINC